MKVWLSKSLVKLTEEFRMAKMRIHELAKELELQSKDIIACLEGLGIDKKSAQSSLEDDQVTLVKEKLTGKKEVTAKVENKKENNEAAKAAEESKASEGSKASEENKASAAEKKTEETSQAAPVKKKKSNIIFVSNPHNSQDKKKADGRPSQMSKPQNKPQTNNQQASAGRPGKIQLNVPKTATLEMTARGEKYDQEEKAQQNQNASNSKKDVQKPDDAVRSSSDSVNSNIGNDGYRKETEEVRKAETAPDNQSNRNNSQAGNGQKNDNFQRRNDNNGNNGNFQRRNDNNGNFQKRNDNRDNRNDNRSDNRGDNRNFNRNDNRNDNRGDNRSFNRNDNRQDNSRGQQNRDNNGYSQNRGQQGRDGNGQRNNQGGMNGNRFAGGQKDRNNNQSFASNEPTTNPNEKRRNQDKKSKEKTYSTEDGFRGGKNNKNAKTVSKLERPQEKKVEVKEEEKIKVITIPEVLTIKDLADSMKIQPSIIIKKLFLQGKVVTVNQEISYEQAEEIALEFEILCEKEVVVDVIEELLKEDEEAEDNMTNRPPVICVMGHVDHGKTSLLDAIRKTRVIDKEAGGITQHIGAYVVNTKGQKITFLDTPGHEAFTAMRMRGANSTDIAILVVAADDGVMPQTIEAINHAKAAGIEIIVAVNKIDKPSANIDRVKQELAEYDLVSEDWGGSTIFAPVSAKTGEGIDNLLDMILLTAEIMELKANAKRRARGLVIEAQLDKGRGSVATVLVQKGTLRVGDFIACGACHGKVRAMIDDKGRRVKEAGPSTPVEILGLNDVPNAGEIFVSPENDKEAKNFAETFIAQNKVKLLDDTKNKMSLDELFSQIQAGNLKELNLIVKADVQGSVEAVKESLMKLSNDEVVVKVIHGGVGAINESDVVLASASNAIIIGFNVRPDATAKATAETEGVDVRLYNVIYKAIEDVEAAMRGMLDPVFEEKIIGHAEIRQIFKASQVGNIAGSYVLDGIFQRNCNVRITHEGEQIFEGKLASLKRFKDDVKEVKSGFECGLVFEDFDRFNEFDLVEAYIMVEVPR